MVSRGWNPLGIIPGIISDIGRGIILGMTSNITTSDKVRENKARRAAARQGLRLAKSRTRDGRATDYGTFMVVDVEGNWLVAEGLYLDEVERYLDGERT